MKRQAAEKRGLWGQVFGVVRIAAQGKKGTAFFDAQIGRASCRERV